jgi:hypothetical protein
MRITACVTVLALLSACAGPSLTVRETCARRGQVYSGTTSGRTQSVGYDYSTGTPVYSTGRYEGFTCSDPDTDDDRRELAGQRASAEAKTDEHNKWTLITVAGSLLAVGLAFLLGVAK